MATTKVQGITSIALSLALGVAFGTTIFLGIRALPSPPAQVNRYVADSNHRVALSDKIGHDKSPVSVYDRSNALIVAIERSDAPGRLRTLKSTCEQNDRELIDTVAQRLVNRLIQSGRLPEFWIAESTCLSDAIYQSLPNKLSEMDGMDIAELGSCLKNDDRLLISLIFRCLDDEKRQLFIEGVVVERLEGFDIAGAMQAINDLTGGQPQLKEQIFRTHFKEMVSKDPFETLKVAAHMQPAYMKTISFGYSFEVDPERTIDWARQQPYEVIDAKTLKIIANRLAQRGSLNTLRLSEIANPHERYALTGTIIYALRTRLSADMLVGVVNGLSGYSEDEIAKLRLLATRELNPVETDNLPITERN